MYKQTFAACIAVSGLSATAAAQQSAGTPAAQAACALPAIAVSAELNQIPGSSLVTVPVEINGKPRKFLLGVSTSPTKVSQATVSDLKLVEGIKRTESFQTGPATWDDGTSMRNELEGSTIQTTFVDAKGIKAAESGRAHVVIPSFTIGGATGKNLLFTVATDGEVPKTATYDGIMTGEFFKQYDVELDFAAMTINYLTPTKCADPHQVVFWPHKEVAIIPMTLVDGKIEVQVAIGGNEINAVIDTSSARTIMRRDIAENRLGLKAGSAQMPPAGDLKDGDDMQVYNATFPQITFAGGVTAFNVPALIQVNGMTHNLHKETMLGSRAQFKADPRIPALTLGMDVLRQLHIYIVYGQNNLYMTEAQ